MNKQEIENAIEAFKHDVEADTDYERATKEHMKLAISALQQQLNNGWILVSERLPGDIYPPVICCNEVDQWTDAAVVTRTGHFINCEGIIIRPTHWRPLPESYKEASDEQN